MGKLRVVRGYRDSLPVEKDADVVYVVSSREGDVIDYGSIVIGEREWVSVEYIDAKIGEIDKLLSEL